MNSLKGTGVALVTPFDGNGNVDYTVFTNLIQHVMSGGVDYLVVLGTTAETPTLTAEEKKQILAHVKKVNAGKLPIVLGIGGNNTADVIAKIRDADFEGVSALLSVTPYYNKPSQQGMYEHYKAVIEASPVPVLLYNVPGRTGVNLTAETTLRLAHDFKNIIGIKEASGSNAQVAYTLRDKPKEFLVISGDDGCALPQMSIGADGVISVLANALPKEVSEMVRLAQKQNYVEAAKIHLQLLEITDALFAEGNPVGIKAVLNAKGLIENKLRLPLVSASDALMARIRKILAK
jgi:4-hydroxy-tetrahydrodipicolinate synthase